MDRKPPAPPHMTLNRFSEKDLCSGTHTDDLCLDKQTKMTGVYILAKGIIENREAIILRTGRIFLGRYLTKEFSKHECKGNYGLISQPPGPGGSVEIIAKSEEIACKLLALKDLKVEKVTLLFERKDIKNAQQIKNKGGEVLVLVPGSTKMVQRNDETEKDQSEILMTKRARTSPDKETSPDKVDFDLNQFKKVNDYCENDKFIGGDLNLHNKMWDTTSKQDQQSFAFAYYILEPDSNLCLITPCDLGTRVNVTNGKYSTLDLSLVSYSLPLNQHVELAGAVESDHLPLIGQLEESIDYLEFKRTKMWNFCCNKWPSWQSIIASKLQRILTDNSIDLLNKQVTDLLVKTSENKKRKKKEKSICKESNNK
ncbi:hypothetical protein QYM36_018634 [Artemia franciscana]|uniref:Endonuclease/exonuclease/phosphatase domain-containing protein n=1 Tax=Artemia franciscana TaxID=6661 RepID=A0AA88KUE1_ARTSF|nr:hypothetical protein QYM36_018634 [Artemia franciscana]